MAHSMRPPLRSSTERPARQAKSPAAAPQVEKRAKQHHNNVHRPNDPIATRRSLRGTPLLALHDDKPARPATPATASPPLARTSSRKRPATALADATTPDTRPPTKVTVTQPHGQLVRITNGVPRTLAIGDDEVRSGASTPRSNSAGPAPRQAPAAQDKRSLRSHDGGSRMKSDLAVYFSNYDDVIAGVPKPPEFLDLDTPIYIVDEPLKNTNTQAPPPSPPKSTRASTSPSRQRKARPRTPPPQTAPNPPIPAAQSSTTFVNVDYSSIARHIHHDDDEDPLADSVYFAQHRRAERKEKQLRNIEKERAMHEKVQLERLLDGLQGPDWLKVMGITGVTDGERKDWEPKRDYFVKEVEALVDKFRVWKEEEKRLRAEKEAALAAKEEEQEDDGDEEHGSESASDTIEVNGKGRCLSKHRPKEEPAPARPRRPPRPHGFLLPYVAPAQEPTTPFTSFYAKPHLRAAALGKHRHGRNVTAFGLPVPEFEEHEFFLPDEWVTPEFLRDNARKRRRQKRESVAGARGRGK